MTQASLSMSHRIITNIVWNFFGQGCLLVFSFFATPFIIHRLSVDLYGIYVLTGVMIGYFAFLDLGLGSASVKYISQYLAKNEKEKICEVFWSCFTVYFLMGLLGMGIIFFSAPILVNHFFKIPDGFKVLAVTALKIGSLRFLISMLLGVVSSVVRAVGRFDILNKTGIVLGALQIGLTVLLLVLKFSLISIIVSNIVVGLLSLVWYWKLAKALLPFLSAQPCFTRKALFQLFKFGGFVSISGFVAPVLTHIEKIFLTALWPVAYLTYYSVPFSLVDSLSLIRSSFSSTLFPTFSYLRETEKAHFNRDLHYRSTLYIFFLYFFFIVFFSVFGRDFLRLWLGEDFAIRSARILLILIWAGLINAMAAPSLSFLQGAEKPYIPAIFHVIEAILYIPSSYFLIMKWGGVGAALAWVLRVALDTFLLQWSSCRFLKERLLNWYGRIIFRAFFPSISCLALFWGLKRFQLFLIHPFNLGGLVVILLCYAGVVWVWGMDDFGRQRMKEYLRSLSK